METGVFAAVLFAAACHAGWNALIKVGLEPLATTTLISIGARVVALVVLPVVGFPAAAAWPWLITSVAIHLLYFGGLIEAYRSGDLGQVYPIARGSAPLMTATATTLVIGERLSLTGWAGIVTLVAGVFLLSVRGGDRRDATVLVARAHRRAPATDVLRHCDLGDDAVANRGGGGAARDQRAVRAAIAVVMLKEPLRAVRIAAAALIVAGLILIRVG
jgi:multidrug transporter EmrE-like cation transporter